MGQMLVRRLDDARLERLKRHAKAERTSAEALARDAIHGRADQLTVEEKLAVVSRMQDRYRSAMIPGVIPTPGADLIREDRDR